MATWETAADWDAAVAESGVAHEAITNTDHVDASILRQGYSITNPYLAASLRAYWPLHEDSGSTAHDLGGSSYDASLNGTTLGVTGLLGTTGFSFNGSSDYGRALSDSLAVGTGDLSIAAWLKAASGTGTILGVNWDAGAAVGLNWGSGSLPKLSASDGTNDNDVTGTTSIADGSWHYVVGVRDAGASESRIYVDGTLENTATWSTAANLAPDNDMALGGWIGSNGSIAFYYDGDMAEVRVYGTALSNSDVGELHDVVDTPGTLTTDWRQG